MTASASPPPAIPPDAPTAAVPDVAIVVPGAAGRVTTWSEGASRMLGPKHDEIPGRPISTFYPEEDAAAGEPERDLDVASRRGQYDEQRRRRRKDVSAFVAQVAVSPLHADGRLEGYAKVMRDGAQPAAAEEALRSREAHPRSILETVPAAMIVIDETRRRAARSGFGDVLESIRAALA